MASETNKPQNELNNDFGLPKAEFKPIESTGNSKWLKMTLIIAGIVLIIGVGVLFWLFQRPSSTLKNDFVANTLEIHQAEEDVDDGIEEQSTTGDATKLGTKPPKAKNIGLKDNKAINLVKKPQVTTNSNQEAAADSDDAALEELDKISDSFIAKPEHKPSSFIEQLRAGEFDHKVEKKGENEDEPAIVTITERKGFYYVVVASHVDVDLAMDYAKKIVQKGAQVKVIMPDKNGYFVRLAVAQEKTFAAASQKIQQLKAEYGESVWVMKH